MATSKGHPPWPVMLRLTLYVPLLWLFYNLDRLGGWANEKQGKLLDETEYWLNLYPPDK